MELKNINLNRKDFQNYFYNRHFRNWSIVSIPLLLIMVIIAFIARVITLGFDFVGACYLITLFVAALYLFTIIKLSKSYENKPYDLIVDKGIYQIKRKNDKQKIVTTFKKDLKDFIGYDQTKSYYYLFPEKNTTFVLPKSLFNEEDNKYFYAQITKKIKKRKTPWFSRVINVVLSISAILFSIFFIIGIFQ